MIDPDLITHWREALVTYLTAQFPDAKVKSGERSGVSRSEELIAVFWPGWQEDSNPNYARPTMVVRMWPGRSKQPTKNPDDPTPLEQAAMRLMIALQAVDKPGDLVDNLYCRLASVQPDYDPKEWGIEAVLVSWTINPATLT